MIEYLTVEVRRDQLVIQQDEAEVEVLANEIRHMVNKPTLPAC